MTGVLIFINFPCFLQLSSRFGADFDKYLIKELIEQIDLKDPNKVSKDKNEAVKSQLLSQELSRCSQKPDFLKYFDDVSICGFFAIFDTLNIFKSFLYKLKQGGPFVV